MMKWLLIVPILFSWLNLFAQSKPDDGLADFIRMKNYVQLTDTVHLPKSIIPYRHAIEDNLSAQKYAAPADVYVNAAYVQENSYGLTVPIMNLTGIKFIKHEYDEAQKANGAIKAKDTVINGHTFKTIPATEILFAVSIGNPSGRERVLKINKTDGSIATFITQ